MAIYRVTDTSIDAVPQTTFEQANILERRDLQRLLKSRIAVIAPDVLVIGEEYGDWEESKRRIDLLCLDKQARLVVVELKRTDDGGHMELQAIRYAAMVSSMTFEQLVSAHTRYLGGGEDNSRAKEAIINFLEWTSETDGSLSDDVRIILVAADFSIELTTAVLWLNKQDLDITCVRLRPHRLGNEVLIDIQQIIPLPEAAEYETKIRAQQQETRRLKSNRNEVFPRFWSQLIERSHGKTDLLQNRGIPVVNWLTYSRNVKGFNFNFVIRRDQYQIECYIDLGKGSEDRNVMAFRALLQQKAEIEGAYGGALDWQELEDSRACRICELFEGGWRSAEAEWPSSQDHLINAMVRLEAAFRNPIRNIKLPSE